MKVFDISRPVSPAIAVWPGDQRFEHRWTMHQGSGASVNVGAVTMSVHTGTHADAPLHVDATGRAIGALGLEPYVGPAVVVEVQGPRIDINEVRVPAVSSARRVLFKTAASAAPVTTWPLEFPSLTEDAAAWLATQGCVLVGTDAPSVDEFHSKTLPVHHALARGGVAILESLSLAHVPPGRYELIALPLRLMDLDASPVRAVLRPIDQGDETR